MFINTNRDYVFDIAKGLGIILVVLGHSGFTFTNFIYLFHVALFFIISGYFFNEKYSNSLKQFKEFFIKKVKTLYLPFVITNIGVILFHNFFVKHNIILLKSLDNLSYDFKHITGSYWNIGKIVSKIFDVLLMSKYIDTWLTIATWFLKALFFISIFSCLIYLLKKKIKTEHNFELVQGAIYVGLMISGYIMYLCGFNEYLAGTICSCSFFFYLGILYKKYKGSIHINYVSAIVSVIVLLICYKIYPQKISILNNFYHNPLWITVSSVSGFILTMYVSKLLNKIIFVRNVLTYVGQHTVIILCLHTLSFKIITCAYIHINHLPQYMLSASPVLYSQNLWIYYSFIGICLPITCVLIKDYAIKILKSIRN